MRISRGSVLDVAGGDSSYDLARMNASPSDALRRCPRCGYDQAGVIEHWVHECPVDGTCAECGLSFRWRDIFFPPPHPLRQWPECTRRTWLVPLAGIAAPFLAMAPWWLFRGVTMSDPLRWKRLVFVAIEWIVIHQCIAIVWFWCYIGMHPMYGWPSVVRDAGTYLLLPLERFYFDSVDWHQGPHATYARAMSEWIWATLMVWPGWRIGGIVLVTAVASTLAFAILPIARRRAKVRAAHLVRAVAVILASGLIMLSVLSFVVGWAMNARIYWGSVTHLVDSIWTLPYTGAVFVWLVVWWHAIASRYLRMRRPWAVALSVSSVGTLATWLGVAILATALH
ncbi:MAG: hypothetical protein JNM94_17270 [Phycisphaerae bacterium]|nr:hypothetical protein [Phycisphaerae bacterium]